MIVFGSFNVGYVYYCAGNQAEHADLKNII